MILRDPFVQSIIVIVALGVLGPPIGYAMICESILYLIAAGLDLGTVAEQLLNGLYSSDILIVSLFIK